MPVTVTPRLRDGGLIVASGSAIVPKDDALDLVITDPDPGGETFTLRLLFVDRPEERAGYVDFAPVDDRLEVTAVNFRDASAGAHPVEIATTEAGESVRFAFQVFDLGALLRRVEYTVTVRGKVAT